MGENYTIHLEDGTPVHLGQELRRKSDGVSMTVVGLQFISGLSPVCCRPVGGSQWTGGTAWYDTIELEVPQPPLWQPRTEDDGDVALVSALPTSRTTIRLLAEWEQDDTILPVRIKSGWLAIEDVERLRDALTEVIDCYKKDD